MRGCTAKGGKLGSGGKVVKVVVAISYGKGAIVCHQCDKLDGSYFAEFVQDSFENMFRITNKNGSRLSARRHAMRYLLKKQSSRNFPQGVVIFTVSKLFFMQLR